MAKENDELTEKKTLGFKLVKKGDEFEAKYDGGAVIPIEKEDGLLFDLACMIEEIRQDKEITDPIQNEVKNVDIQVKPELSIKLKVIKKDNGFEAVYDEDHVYGIPSIGLLHDLAILVDKFEQESINGQMCKACVYGCSKGKTYPECGLFNSKAFFEQLAQAQGKAAAPSQALSAVNVSAATNPDYPGQTSTDKFNKMNDKWICEKCGGPKSTAVCVKCDMQEPAKKQKPKQKSMKKEEAKQELVKNAPVVPVNAEYLYSRRKCSKINESLDCKDKTGQTFCGYNGSNENECPNFVEKKRDDIFIKIVDQNYYLVLKNGIEEHVHKKFDCTICNDLKPVAPKDKCPKCPFLPDDLTKFKCEQGICYSDKQGRVTISHQHPAGYLFCLNACPRYRIEGGPKENIPESKNAAPKPPAIAKKPKKEQPKLF